MHRMRVVLVSVLTCLLWGAGAARAQEIATLTRPSNEVTLAFVRSGKVSRMLVKEGDRVKKGQLLAHLDDAAEQVQVEQLRAEAEDRVRVKAAEAQLAQKQVDLMKLEEAFSKKAVSKWDVEHARLEVVMRELSLELAKFERVQAGRKYEEAKIQLTRMRLESPIDGRVEEILIQEGESADELEDVVRVVEIDPLWIKVPVPLSRARGLETGGRARVTFVDGSAEPAFGKIVHKGDVADAASLTLLVRVELDNPNRRPAGEHVRVDFP